MRQHEKNSMDVKKYLTYKLTPQCDDFRALALLNYLLIESSATIGIRLPVPETQHLYRKPPLLPCPAHETTYRRRTRLPSRTGRVQSRSITSQSTARV